MGGMDRGCQPPSPSTPLPRCMLGYTLRLPHCMLGYTSYIPVYPIAPTPVSRMTHAGENSAFHFVGGKYNQSGSRQLLITRHRSVATCNKPILFCRRWIFHWGAKTVRLSPPRQHRRQRAAQRRSHRRCHRLSSRPTHSHPHTSVSSGA